jgi:MFS family permease
MRSVTAMIAVALAAFAALQYDDPDGAAWTVSYGAAALWCALVAWRPERFSRRWAILPWAMGILSAGAAVVAFWPTADAWWRVEVWWRAERVREGMGLMIVAAALVWALMTSLKAGERRG